MQQFFSISQYPGKTGQYYYQSFFKEYKIDASYTPLGSESFRQTFDEVVKTNPCGISVSMPFKQDVIELVDDVDVSVLNYDTCNTVKFVNQKTVGYNADLFGVIEVCKYFDIDDSISVLGNGCMANMFKKYLNKSHIKQYARSLENWDLRHQDSKVFINCTALGTSEKKSPLEYIPGKAKIIIDLAVNDNNLKKICQESNIKYYGGLNFYKAQFLKQFEIYTDKLPDPDFFDYLTRTKL